MGLADVVRSGVSIANSLTGDLQVTVQHYAWTGSGAHAAPTYAAPVSRKAILDETKKIVRNTEGQEVWQAAQITFVGPVASNGASGRREPIDPRDKFVLPNGYTGPIISVGGPVDPSTGAAYLHTVSLG